VDCGGERRLMMEVVRVVEKEKVVVRIGYGGGSGGGGCYGGERNRHVGEEKREERTFIL
jgi:hypothetical protein